MKQLPTRRNKPATTKELEEKYLPGIAIDSVIFGFHENQLKILLLKYHNTGLFALPGGFIRKEENISDAALRILTDRTGLENIYLEQFYVFGDYARFDPEPLKTIMRANGLDTLKNQWLLRRFLTVGFYALVDYTRVVPIPDQLSDSCEWYDLDNLPILMLDHRTIVEKALETLRNDLDRKLNGFNLLPKKFTMGELQSLYETVLGEKLLRTSFQRKILNLGILKLVDKKWTGGAHKAPYLYSFVKNKSK